MKYLYSKVDGVTLTYGRIRRRGGIDEIPVYFERESQNGDFDFAEGVAPQCVFHRSKGFSELELSLLSTYSTNPLYVLPVLYRNSSNRRTIVINSKYFSLYVLKYSTSSV